MTNNGQAISMAPIRVVKLLTIVAVIVRLRTSIRQAKAHKPLKNVLSKALPDIVKGRIPGGVTRNPHLNARATTRVDMKADEERRSIVIGNIAPRLKLNASTCRARYGRVRASGHDNSHTVVLAELITTGLSDFQRQQLLLKSIANRSRVIAAMPRIKHNGLIRGSPVNGI